MEDGPMPEIEKRIVRNAELHTLNLDVSRLNQKQRRELSEKLKELSRGIAPDGVGSLVSAEGNHSSHNDTDGWI